MPKEFEAKFLDIDVEKMREKLKNIGASRVHDRIMLRRSVFQLCNSKIRGYARVRDDGVGVSMTSKTYADPNFPEENEVQIKEDYETGVKFMESLGLDKKAEQESYREKWKHDLVHEITFDTLPGLPTWMEIDCTSEENLNQAIELLNLDKSKMRFGAFDLTYNEYYGIEQDVINNKTPYITFANIINEIKPIKNKDLLEELHKSYNIKGGKKKSKKTSKKNSKKSSKKNSKRHSKKSSKDKSKNRKK
jgi:adenylate cyclase class 2